MRRTQSKRRVTSTPSRLTQSRMQLDLSLGLRLRPSLQVEHSLGIPEPGLSLSSACQGDARDGDSLSHFRVRRRRAWDERGRARGRTGGVLEQGVP
eukprot:112293-Rhodomonas_salina.1